MSGRKVGLRPHQVAYMTRHQHASVWLLVRRPLTGEGHEVLLYHARQAVDVWAEGCDVRPVLRCPAPVDWDAILDTIAPEDT